MGHHRVMKRGHVWRETPDGTAAVKGRLTPGAVSPQTSVARGT